MGSRSRPSHGQPCSMSNAKSEDGTKRREEEVSGRFSAVVRGISGGLQKQKTDPEEKSVEGFWNVFGCHFGESPNGVRSPKGSSGFQVCWALYVLIHQALPEILSSSPLII